MQSDLLFEEISPGLQAQSSHNVYDSKKKKKPRTFWSRHWTKTGTSVVWSKEKREREKWGEMKEGLACFKPCHIQHNWSTEAWLNEVKFNGLWALTTDMAHVKLTDGPLSNMDQFIFESSSSGHRKSNKPWHMFSHDKKRWFHVLSGSNWQNTSSNMRFKQCFSVPTKKNIYLNLWAVENDTTLYRRCKYVKKNKKKQHTSVRELFFFYLVFWKNLFYSRLTMDSNGYSIIWGWCCSLKKQD